MFRPLLTIWRKKSQHYKVTLYIRILNIGCHKGISVRIRNVKFYYFFCGRYSPWRTLASFTIALHWSSSCDFRLQFLTPIVFKSSSTESSHLSVGLPTLRVPSGLCTVNRNLDHTTILVSWNVLCCWPCVPLCNLSVRNPVEHVAVRGTCRGGLYVQHICKSRLLYSHNKLVTLDGPYCSCHEA
jgi:hypothetical protein